METITINDLNDFAVELEESWNIQNLMHGWTVNEKHRDTTEIAEMSKRQILDVINMLDTMKHDINRFQSMLKSYSNTLEH